jgi:mannose-6-phosphate isomerase-like protein (cupin superfamily)
MSDNCWSAVEVIKKAQIGEGGHDDKHNINYTFLHHGDHCTLNAVQMADEKHGIPLHIHRYHDEIIQLMEGEGEVVIGDVSHNMKKGDVFFVPKGTPHALRFGCIILSIYAPAFDPANPDRVFFE